MRDAARSAIEEPIQVYNRLRATDRPPVNIEPELIEVVLKQVETGRFVLAEAGRGNVGGRPSPTQARIEAPYLQLVMTRLWDEEQRIGSYVLRLETLNRLGGAGHIVRTHLDTALGALLPHELDVAARVFHHLVPPSGSRQALTLPDLAQYAPRRESRRGFPSWSLRYTEKQSLARAPGTWPSRSDGSRAGPYYGTCVS